MWFYHFETFCVVANLYFFNDIGEMELNNQITYTLFSRVFNLKLKGGTPLVVLLLSPFLFLPFLSISFLLFPLFFNLSLEVWNPSKSFKKLSREW